MLLHKSLDNTINLDFKSGYVTIQRFTAVPPGSSSATYRIEWKYGSDFQCLYEYYGQAKSWDCSGNSKYNIEVTGYPGYNKLKHVNSGKCLTPKPDGSGRMNFLDCSEAPSFHPRPDGNGVELQFDNDQCPYAHLTNGERARHADCGSSASPSYTFKLKVP